MWYDVSQLKNETPLACPRVSNHSHHEKRKKESDRQTTDRPWTNESNPFHTDLKKRSFFLKSSHNSAIATSTITPNRRNARSSSAPPNTKHQSPFPSPSNIKHQTGSLILCARKERFSGNTDYSHQLKILNFEIESIQT